MKQPSPSFLRTFGAPILIGLFSVIGLVSALLGEGGPADWLSWASLAVPVLVILWALKVRRS